MCIKLFGALKIDKDFYAMAISCLLDKENTIIMPRLNVSQSFDKRKRKTEYVKSLKRSWPKTSLIIPLTFVVFIIINTSKKIHWIGICKVQKFKYLHLWFFFRLAKANCMKSLTNYLVYWTFSKITYHLMQLQNFQ